MSALWRAWRLSTLRFSTVTSPFPINPLLAYWQAFSVSQNSQALRSQGAAYVGPPQSQNLHHWLQSNYLKHSPAYLCQVDAVPRLQGAMAQQLFDEERKAGAALNKTRARGLNTYVSSVFKIFEASQEGLPVQQHASP